MRVSDNNTQHNMTETEASISARTWKLKTTKITFRKEKLKYKQIILRNISKR